MIFSKSFGYAIRSVLYVAIMRDEKRYVQVEEVASRLAVPRHFMGKIMKKLAKEKILVSTKGPSGGFILNAHTLTLPLMNVIEIIDGVEIFDSCALRAKECNSMSPCPMHSQLEPLKHSLKSILSDTTIGDLLEEDKPEFIKSISTALDTNLVKELAQVSKLY
jgi:Rrf2 family transcriptional regulator, iron-sulfur cluster assembly transcription factor